MGARAPAGAVIEMAEIIGAAYLERFGRTSTYSCGVEPIRRVAAMAPLPGASGGRAWADGMSG